MLSLMIDFGDQCQNVRPGVVWNKKEKNLWGLAKGVETLQGAWWSVVCGLWSVCISCQSQGQAPFLKTMVGIPTKLAISWLKIGKAKNSKQLEKAKVGEG